jgi:uncharacterized protein
MSDHTPLRLAVVTGQHAFDVPAFHTLFRSLPGVDAYIQHMEDFAAANAPARAWYDAVLFYNFHQTTPDDGQRRGDKAMQQALGQLGQSKQGIVVLHHALLAYPKWDLWSELCGIQDRRFGFHDDQTVRTAIAQPNHPITVGLSTWEMVDETYTMPDAGAGSEILLATEHPLSMKTLAWTRRFGQARVFCYEAGHDNQAFANPSFRTVLARGIQWTAERL